MLTGRQRRQLWYVPVLAVATALMMVRIMVAARLFDVTAFAEYNTGLLLSTTFCMLACLGLQSLLQRNMPVLLARRQERAALVLMMQALLVAGACALAALVPAALGAGAVQVSAGLAMLGVLHGLSQQLFLITTVESRSRGDPLRYARQSVLRAVAVVAGGAVVAASTGSPALTLATEALLSLALVAGSLAAIGRRTGWSMLRLAALAHRSWARLPVRTAAVLLAISGVGFTLLNVDRWLAASWLAQPAFAQFAFAAVVLLAAQSVQNMINASVYPMIARRFALHGTEAAFRLCCWASVVSLVAGLLLAWPAHLVAELAITRWFPAYQPAIGLLWPLLAAGVLRVADYWSSFLMICNHERTLLKIQVAACLAAGGAWLLLAAGRGPFDPSALDIAWLSLLLAAASHLTSATSAVALRQSDPSKERLTHAQSQ